MMDDKTPLVHRLPAKLDLTRRLDSTLRRWPRRRAIIMPLEAVPRRGAADTTNANTTNISNNIKELDAFECAARRCSLRMPRAVATRFACNKHTNNCARPPQTPTGNGTSRLGGAHLAAAAAAAEKNCARRREREQCTYSFELNPLQPIAFNFNV